MSLEDSRKILMRGAEFNSAERLKIYKALKALNNGRSFSFSIGKDFPAPTQGDLKYIYIPSDCTLVSVGVIGTASATIQFDVWKASSADFNPPIDPSDADSIVGTNHPYLSGSAIYTDTTLEGWDTSFQTGDVIAVYVDSVSGEFDSIIVLGFSNT